MDMKEEPSTSSGIKRSIPQELQDEIDEIVPKRPRTTAKPADLDENQKRWFVVGICLHRVISPALRNYVVPILTKLCYKLVVHHRLETQTFPTHLPKHPLTNTFLNYEAVNNNKVKHGYNKQRYDYKIKSVVDLSKLFLQTHMAHYTGFDDTCDLSALLGLIINIDQFDPVVKSVANDVRRYIRNALAHWDFTEWDAVKYLRSFQLMKKLIKELKLSLNEETQIIGEIEKWKMNGPRFLRRTTYGHELVNEFRQQTRALAEDSHKLDQLKKDIDKRLFEIDEVLVDQDKSLKNHDTQLAVLRENSNQCACHGSLLTEGIYCDGYFIDCDVHHSLIGSNSFCKRTAKGSLLTEGIYCDGYFIDCDVHHSLIGSNSFCKRTAKDNMAIKSNYNFESTNEFECLVITSSYLKTEQGRLSLLNEDSFLQSVVKSQDLLCRLMLTYSDDSEETLLYLFKVLEFAIEKKNENISMAIAWRLTWVYFIRIKYDFPTLKDIWPALRCTCKKKSEVQCDVCLSETVIVVQLDTYSAKSLEMFYTIPVIFYTDGISDKLPLATRTIPYIDEMPITDSSAKSLFDNHRNLTLICKSSFLTLPKTYRPSNTKSEIKQCVQLYCKAKGLIPVGEKHFPKMFCGLPTKVVEGTPTLMGGLQIGSKIGTDNFKKGTLGGFVRFRGEDAFLTCLHVFLTAEQLTEDKITLDDNESYRVKCYQNATAWSNKDDGFVCGKIQDFGFEINCEGTSVDAALIQLEKGIGIDSSHFLATTGLESCYLNDICVDYKSFVYSDPRPEITTVCIGAITGISKTISNVKVEKAVDIEIEVFNKTFSVVILERMRAYVVDVIQTLQSRSDPAIPIQQRICTATDEICGADMSAETKEGIVEIVDCIYPKIISGDNGDQSEKINQLLNEVTVEKTTSKFSGILSDVHMQTTVLKMTIDSAKRMSRRIYNQIHIPDIPFKMGDSGTCIFVVKPIKG